MPRTGFIGAEEIEVTFLITAATPAQFANDACIGGSAATQLPTSHALYYCVTVTLRMRDMVSPSLSISNSLTEML